MVAGTPFDLAMMRRALFHAARGQGRTTPNPMVGAVIVSPEGVVLSHGWHERAGEAHAEVHALDAAGENARGATAYVTLEPCCHVGRTGPCTQRLLAAGIARVVAAMPDPDPRVSGKGFAELRAHGIVVDEGLCAQEAAQLNYPFITVKTKQRPWVVLKAATSLDAMVAAGIGERTALTSPAANRRTQLLRASVDAIAVGSETLSIDDPLLTVREMQRVRPLIRVIFDRRLRTAPSARVFSTLSDGAVIIVTAPFSDETGARRHALEAAGATLVPAASLEDGLRALVRWDISSVLVEGGPHLQAALVEARLVDRLHLVIAPHVIGPRGVPWIDSQCLPLSAFAHLSAEPRGADIWIEADVYGHR